MSIPINNIIRSATRTNEPLNILWFPYDGFFETLLLPNLPHKFYGAHDIECVPWDTNTSPPPENFYTLVAHNSLSLMIDYDVVVCQGKLKNYDKAIILAHNLHIPLILIEHLPPPDVVKTEDLFLLEREKKAHFYVATSKTVNQTWKVNYTLADYFFPLQKSYPKKDQILVYGKLENKEDLILISEYSKLPVKVINTLENHTQEDYLNTLKESKFYLNLNKDTILPTIYAMTFGCTPLHHETPLLPEKRYYSFTSQNELILLLKRIDNLQPIDNQQYITETFPISNLEKWNEIFNSIYNYVYTR